MDIEFFDMNNVWVYLIYIVLTGLLFVLRIPPQDTLFILINVIIYTAITSFIFYFHTKYEEKRIKEKYLKNLLSMLYESDPGSFEENKKNIFSDYSKKKKVSILNQYATIIIAVTFLLMSVVYFVKKRDEISIAKVVENSYYLSILGMTEIFVTFFVMSRMPYPDIFNLIDVMIRRREKCSIQNAIKLSGSDPYIADPVPTQCDSFSKDGDRCEIRYEDKLRVFSCVDGKIERETQSL